MPSLNHSAALLKEDEPQPTRLEHLLAVVCARQASIESGGTSLSS